MAVTAQLLDVLAADDIKKKAQYGYFDTEFTAYGTVYVEEGKRQYRISSAAGDIYQFIEKSDLRHNYCASVYSLSRQYKTLSGMHDDNTLRVKYDLAKELQEIYPLEFFEMMHTLARKLQDNSAYEVLKNMQKNIAGLFDEHILFMFGQLVEHSYTSLQLTKDCYQELKYWYEEETRAVGEMPGRNDLFEKILYGISYKTKHGYEVYEDSLKETIYKKKEKLLADGIVSSPIFSQRCYYNYTYRISDVRKDFIEKLKTVLDKTFWSYLTEITDHKKIIDVEHAKLLLKNCEKTYNMECRKTLERYIRLWNVDIA